MSSTFPDPSGHRGICLPSCRAGSQRISDSDISDYEVDDAIGVVPPGAWGNVAGFTVLPCLFCCQLPDFLGSHIGDLEHREVWIILFHGDLSSKLLRKFEVD